MKLSESSSVCIPTNNKNENRYRYRYTASHITSLLGASTMSSVPASAQDRKRAPPIREGSEEKKELLGLFKRKNDPDLAGIMPKNAWKRSQITGQFRAWAKAPEGGAEIADQFAEDITTPSTMASSFAAARVRDDNEEAPPITEGSEETNELIELFARQKWTSVQKTDADLSRIMEKYGLSRQQTTRRFAGWCAGTRDAQRPTGDATPSTMSSTVPALDQADDKRAPAIREGSEEKKELLGLFARKKWISLPKTSNDRDLDSIMTKHGWKRSQVARQFGAWVRTGGVLEIAQ